jgi:hypothetical protein
MRPLWIWAVATHLPVVVSLTSFPARINCVLPVLRSILYQLYRPDRIVLSLARTEFPGGSSDLPPDLRAFLELHGDVVSILWVEGNDRSYKKLLPALNEFPDSIVVTADDDTIYPVTWLRDIWCAHLQFPDSIVGSRGKEIKAVEGVLEPYLSWPDAKGAEPSHRVFLTGVGGILYPPGSLHPMVSESALAVSICPTADDIWFKFMAVMQGTTCVASSSKPSNFVSVPRSQRESLLLINVNDGKNDAQLVAIQAYLGDRIESVFEDD